MADPRSPQLSPPQLWTVALVCAFTVANLYFAQPLLHAIALGFGVPPGRAGVVVSATQIGYATALVLVVPLGDIVRRRPLACGLLCVAAVAMTASALAPSVTALTGAGAVVGIGSVVVQILMALAATTTDDQHRNHAVGVAFSGILSGILLSRVYAGLVAGWGGSWRIVFASGAVLMLASALALWRLLPTAPAELPLSYRAQMRAVASQIRDQPILRRRCVIGGSVFGAFTCFWSTVTFLLTGPAYRFGEVGVGVFALVGVTGVAGARILRTVDAARGSGAVTGYLLAAMIAAFALLGVGGGHLAVLIGGAVLLDGAVQGVILINQSVVYGLTPDGRARTASIYVTSHFVGGSIGALAGTAAYAHGGWSTAAVTGAAIAAVGLGGWALGVYATRRASSTSLST